jgi:hypothetical protein
MADAARREPALDECRGRPDQQSVPLHGTWQRAADFAGDESLTFEEYYFAEALANIRRASCHP